MRAWRQAGRQMSGRTKLANRWTQTCFCGQGTAAGPVDDESIFGLPQLTGSEEGRGPLFDLTREEFEGVRSPASIGAQGRKITTVNVEIPTAAPLLTIRIGHRLIVSVPGEPKRRAVRFRGLVRGHNRG